MGLVCPERKQRKRTMANGHRTDDVIAPILKKTDSLTGGLLHVNDDSILRKVDQDDGR